MSEEIRSFDGHKSYRLKSVVGFLILAVIGLLLIVFSALFVESVASKNVFISISSTIVVTGLLGFIYEYLLRNDLLNIINNSSEKSIEQIRVANISHELGLSEISQNANSYDFSEFLLHKNDIIIILNDGRSWFSTHEADIEDRLKMKGKSTKVILVNPGSEFLPSLSKKVSQDPESLKSKIKESTSILTSHASNDHNLLIYYHDLPTTYSLYMCEDYARLVLYPMARKADKVPMFIFQNTGINAYYNSLKRDVSKLLELSNQKHPNDLFTNNAS